jgi:hypothetical protein
MYTLKASQLRSKIWHKTSIERSQFFSDFDDE